jgi:anti-sigma factor RsiW
MNVFAYIPGTQSWTRRRSAVVCRKTMAHVQEIVDGEIPPGRAATILERHIEACPPCKVEAESIRMLKAAVARVMPEADAECVERLNNLARRLCQGQVPPDTAS